MRHAQHAQPLAAPANPAAVIPLKTAPAAARAVTPDFVRPIHVSGYERTSRDFYATPAWVTRALLDHIALRGPVWEPCCGDGAMARVLADAGHRVVSTDIADRGFGMPGIDFLACRAVPDGCRAIVTNPPYGEASRHPEEARSSSAAMLGFLRHALSLTESVRGQLALLVRLQWIAGQRAAEMMSAAPFASVIVLRQRIQWFDHGPDTKRAQHHHAWVVFDHAHPRGQPPTMLFG